MIPPKHSLSPLNSRHLLLQYNTTFSVDPRDFMSFPYLSSRLQASFLLLFLSLSFCDAQWACADDEIDLRKQFQAIVDRSIQGFEATVQDLEVDYTIGTQLLDQDYAEFLAGDRTATELRRTVSLRLNQRGAHKYRELLETRVDENEATKVVDTYESAFDGNTGQVRSSDLPSVLRVGKSGKFFDLGSRPPHEDLQLYITELLGNHLEPDGYDVLQIVRDSGLMTVELAGKPGYRFSRYVIEFDADQGYLPVMGRATLLGDVPGFEFDVEIAQVEVDGNLVFYPKLIKSRNYSDGKLISRESIETDVDSIRLNVHPPEGAYQLEPEVGDEIYDVDMQIYLKESGKSIVMDLSPEGLALPIESRLDSPEQARVSLGSPPSTVGTSPEQTVSAEPVGSWFVDKALLLATIVLGLLLTVIVSYRFWSRM